MSVVDSCGWLEHFANGCNAEFFVPILAATDPLIVPSRTAALNAARTFLLGAAFRIDSVVMRKAANPSPLRGSIATRGLHPGRGLVLVIT